MALFFVSSRMEKKLCIASPSFHGCVGPVLTRHGEKRSRSLCSSPEGSCQSRISSTRSGRTEEHARMLSTTCLLSITLAGTTLTPVAEPLGSRKEAVLEAKYFDLKDWAMGFLIWRVLFLDGFEEPKGHHPF